MDEKKYLKRKEKALKDGNRDQLANICNHLGDFYNQQGRYLCAVKEYQEEAELYSKLGKKLEMAKAHRMLGEMYMLCSEFDKAKEHINIYLKTAKKLHNKVEEQRAYATLGRAHLLHGQSTDEAGINGNSEQLKQAEKAFLKSLLLIKELSGQISKLEQLDMQARCYLNIGVVKEHMEDFEESTAYIEKAINISKTHELFELTHLCYISMSLLYYAKKYDATLALRYCNLALEVAKRLPNKVKKICETLITKSEILIKEGDFASAKQILTKAYKKNTPDENDRNAIEKSLRIVVKICQTLDDLVTTSSVDYETCKVLYERLGDGCCHLLNYKKALEYYQQMLKCAELKGETGKQLIPIYVSLYQTYKDNKEYNKALEYLWKEYDLNKDEPEESFSTLCAIAEVCELQTQSYWTIQDIYEKAKVQATKAGDAREKLEKIAMVRLKKLQLKHNMHTLAEDLCKEAQSRGIDLNEESDTESDGLELEHNTPGLGDDICLDELTDTDASDLDESEKPRTHRVTRGTRSIAVKRNNKGETQLHQACIAGNVVLVRKLLEQGHVVNVRDHAGWLPLHEACNHGYRDVVEVLLDKGAAMAINDKGGTSCDGITPLYDACSNGYLDVVELLLERGADATVKTDYGETCVNGLDKWRRSACLTEGEQAHYVHIRSILLMPLAKVGLNGQENTAPLTNASVDNEEEDYDDDYDESLTTRNTKTIQKCDRNRSIDIGLSSKESAKSSPRQHSASKEYKNVMDLLKRNNRVPLLDEGTGSSLNSVKQKRPALLDTEEVDDDTWLIDDIAPEKKKRRYQTPTKELRINDIPNSCWEIDAPTTESDAFDVLLEAATHSNMQSRAKQSQRLSLSRTMSSGSGVITLSAGNRRKSKLQSSLLDSGFCRFRSESPSSEDLPESRTEPDSTTSSGQITTSPTKSPACSQTAPLPLSTIISFKVKVEDELLLVPIEQKKLNDVNIRWLAEEAARRYYNLVGLKPVLRLKTADGFAYEETDAINVALEQTMILATVLEWKISPLPMRYEEMCHQLKKEILREVQLVLDRTQVSNVLQLKQLWLTPTLTEPIFKAVLHQENLRVLDLADNFIQNEGCRQLGKSVPTLKQLKSLNLKCNFITCDGLETLLTSTGTECLAKLEELNLSQNPLGNGSLRILHRFCNSTGGQSMQKLSISQCSITNLYDYDLCYHQLYEFDISYNHLTYESLYKLLGKLNSSRLECLNLNYSKPVEIDECLSASNCERLIEFLESGTCEKFKVLQLCGFSLTDAHIYRMMQCLNKPTDLDVLDISDSPKLSSYSMQYLCNDSLNLRKLIAINCKRLIDDESLLKLEQLKTIPNFLSLTIDNNKEHWRSKLQFIWQSHWGSKAKFRFNEGHVVLYINDRDLLNWT